MLQKFLNFRTPLRIRICAFIDAILVVWAYNPLNGGYAVFALFLFLLGILSRPVVLALIALPLIASFPPIGLGWLLGPFAYTGLFLALGHERSWKKAASLGFLLAVTQGCCFGFWGVSSLENSTVTLLVFLGYVGVLWSGGILVLWALLHAPNGAGRPLSILVVPSLEWFRCFNTFLPFPYIYCSHSIAGNNLLAQWVEPLGVYGLAVLLCATSLASANIIRSFGLESSRSHWWKLGGLTTFLLALHLLGWWRVSTLGDSKARSLNMVVVQEYNPRDGINRYTLERKMELLRRIRRVLIDSKADFLLLPETVLQQSVETSPNDPRELYMLRPKEVIELLSKLDEPKATVIAGIMIDIEKPHSGFVGYRNSAGVLNANGVGAIRDKLIGAPIGEENPFHDIPLLDTLIGERLFEGEHYITTLDSRAAIEIEKDLVFSIAFCFEELFPDIWSKRGLQSMAGIDLQVILADTRWFHYSSIERRQSRAGRQLLSIKHRTPLIYVANGGSEIIGHDGRLVSAVDAKIPSVQWQVPLADPSLDPDRKWFEFIRSFSNVTICLILFTISICRLIRNRKI